MSEGSEEISGLRFANMSMMSDICELEAMLEECLTRLVAFDEQSMSAIERMNHKDFLRRLRGLID